MSLLALALVLVAAVCHATWNLLAKRADSEGVVFVWLMAAAGAVLWVPVAAVAAAVSGPTSGLTWVAYAGSAVLHTVYFVLLQRGYGLGDLSVVYPVARGTGPLLASLTAIAVLGERPGPLGVAGILLISAGVLLLGLPGRRRGRLAPGPGRSRLPGTWQAVGSGLLTGVLIASYTVWDGYAIRGLAVSPILLMWMTDVGRSGLLVPLVLRHRTRLAASWRRWRWYAVAGGLLSPLAYILVLTALRLSPISSVAPLREVSVVLGVLFGTRLLAEGYGGRRLFAACVVAGGAAAIALG